MAVINEPVAVWTAADGVPERLVWRGARYRVTDSPTVWTEPEEWWSALRSTEYGYGTVPVSIGGWRFQATDARTGESLVFDIRSFDESHWTVVRVYV